jgi:hypothetical protein
MPYDHFSPLAFQRADTSSTSSWHAPRPAMEPSPTAPEPPVVQLATAASGVSYAPELLAPLIEPTWLGRLERRIRDSVRRGGQEGENDGRWISQGVADAAIEVLRVAADLLPAEPFIYASKKGDLVFEASGARGPLTLIVSPAFALFFAVVDEQPESRRVDLTIGWSARLRKELQELSAMLRTGLHGAVGSKA